MGEGPGFNEDREGRPFVGRAGGLLVQLLGSIGWQRDDVFITNVVKCRPPDNRDPQPDEIAACAPYLRRQLEALDPAVVVTLGRYSMGDVHARRPHRPGPRHDARRSIPSWGRPTRSRSRCTTRRRRCARQALERESYAGHRARPGRADPRARAQGAGRRARHGAARRRRRGAPRRRRRPTSRSTRPTSRSSTRPSVEAAGSGAVGAPDDDAAQLTLF